MGKTISGRLHCSIIWKIQLVAVKAKTMRRTNCFRATAVSAIEKVWVGGVMQKDALESNPVDEMKFGGGDDPVEVLGRWAGRLFGGLKEDLKEEKEGEAR